MPEKKNTYLTLHKNFVRTDIEYADRVTGESRTFNSVTLPKGTVIDGVDVSYYQFSPMFVNESRFRGENYRDIPLLTDREVWLKKSVLDENGQPIVDENRKACKGRRARHAGTDQGGARPQPQRVPAEPLGEGTRSARGIGAPGKRRFTRRA